MKITMLGSGSYKSSLSFRVVALGRQLVRSGWDVSLIVPSADKYNNFIAESVPKNETLNIIRPWQFTTKSAMLNLVPYLATSFVALLRTKADIIYLYKPTPITVLGLAPRLLFGTPVILDLDDLGSEVMKAEGQSRLQAVLVAACERLTMRFSSAIVVTSTYLASLVVEKHPDKQILVLANGVDTQDYPRSSARKPRPAIYYFGAINRLSLIEELLKALPNVIAAIPETKITIIGGGSALPAARKLVRKLNVAHAVTFTGWVDMYAARKYTKFGDIAVCYQPDTRTVRAASTMKVFQYMAMGSVPVVSDVGDLASYVQHGRAGVVVPPDNYKLLGDAIIELLKDPSWRIELAKQGRRLAETDYSWEQLGQQLADFLSIYTHQKMPLESGATK